MSKFYLCCSLGLKNVSDPMDLSNVNIPQILTDLSNITLSSIITDISNIDISNIVVTNLVQETILGNVSEIVSTTTIQVNQSESTVISEIAKSECVLCESIESINTIVENVNKTSEEVSTHVNQCTKLKDE
jgi:hypothetical protein